MEYRTIVFNAARDGNLSRLKVFLDGRDETQVRDLLSALTFNTPPLVISARNGHLDVVKYLVSKKADVLQTGTVTFDGETIESAPAIWAASAAGHFEILKFLLANGANVNQTTATNSSALRGACFDGHLEIVKYLVDHKADLEIANRHGHTPLMIAAYRNKEDVVRYLLTVGVDVNRKSFRGNTCLHDAAEAGSVPIVSLLLSSGAVMQEDHHGLTPLLSAAAIGHSSVVEHLSGVDDLCSQTHICDAFKLLGATCVDKRRDLAAAVEYWKRAVGLMGEEIGTSFGPVPAVYGTHLEIRTAAQLEEISGDPDALRMQALIIRERILGIRHPDTFYYLRYRGAIYADVGRYDRCFELWMHALSLQQKALRPFNLMTQATITAFAEIFGFMLNDHLTAPNPQNAPIAPNFEDIFTVLKCSVLEMERGNDKEACCQEDLTHCDNCNAPEDISTCVRRLCIVALYLVALIGRLDTKLCSSERQRLMQLLYKLVHMNPISCNQETLLHLCCSEESNNIGRSPVFRFPSLYVCRVLLMVDADPNARNDKGQSALHSVLLCKSVRPSIVRCLLSFGAHIDLKDTTPECRSPLEIMHQRPWGAHLRDILPREHLSLKCLAANVIRKQKIDYELLPSEMVKFVEMH